MSPSEQTETANQATATGVGGLLKASRLRIGEDLRDIADILKIRYVYLEAIEDGRFDDLPGATYSRGFIRTYAEHLGLDSDEVIRRFKDQLSEDVPEVDLVFPEPIPEMGIPGGAIVFIGLLVVVLAYGVWYVNTSKDGFVAELISPLPERLVRQDSIDKPGDKPGDKAAEKPAPAPASTPASAPSSAPKEVAESQPPVDPAAPEAASAETAPAETAAAMTTPGETPSSQAPLVEGEIPDSARIEAIMAEVVKDLASAAETAPVQATIVETHPPESAAAPSVPAPTPEPAHAETPAETSRQASPAPSPPAPESQAAQPPPEPINGPSVIPIDIIPPPAATITTPGTTPGEAAAQETPAPPSVREPETAALPATPAPPSASESTPESQAATPATPAPGGGEEKGRIVVRAKMNSWIQVRDDTVNELLFTRMLRVGDSYAVPGRPGLKLSTGNAGALEILVDGEPVPSIGGEGTVRRNVILDAERLKAGTAVGK